MKYSVSMMQKRGLEHWSSPVKNPSYRGKSDSLKLLKSPVYALHSLGMGV